MKTVSFLLCAAFMLPHTAFGLPKKHCIKLLKHYVRRTQTITRPMNDVTEAIPAPVGYTGLINSEFPFVIDTPGYYLVEEDIFFDGSTASAAITVNPNVGEVTIDFGNFTLNQSVSSSGVSGIAIGSGNTNVTIMGGTINNFSQSGIAIADGCSEIFIDNMTITNCGNRAIEYLGSGGIEHGALTNCLLKGNCTTSAADNVLTLSNCSDLEVRNCIISDNGILGGTISGPLVNIQTIGCARCTFDHVTCADALGNTDVRGFSLNSTTDSRFINCIVDNISSSSTCVGFQLEASSGNANNKFANCRTSNFTGAYTLDGFLADTDSDDNLFEQCESVAHESTNSFGTVHGFRAVNNNRNQFKNCRSHGNSAASNVGTGAHGFKLDTCTDITLQDCKASSHTSAGTAVGFLISNCTAASIFRCIAMGNGLGFDHAGTFNNQAFIQNMALKNTTQYSAAFPATSHDNTAASTSSLLANPWNNIGIV